MDAQETKKSAVCEKLDMKRSSEYVDRLLQLCSRRGRIVIVMQNNPDPDSLASAAAIRDLVHSRLKKRVAIGYMGSCGRAENRAMINILHIDAKQITQAQLAGAKTVCLVDAQPNSGNNLMFTSRVPDAVIDHHLVLKRRTWTAELDDVRPEYGATSTILFEYIRACGHKPNQNLATALFYGIQSDTQDLGREACPADIEAFRELFLLIDNKKLSQIRRAPVPADYFNMLQQSLTDCEVAGSVVVSKISSCANPEMLAEVADLMMRLKGIRVSVCFGLCGENIHLSARGADARSNVAKRMRRVVSRVGTGGGHRTMAGGQVPVNEDPEKKLAMVRNRILKVFAPNKKPKSLGALAQQNQKQTKSNAERTANALQLP